MLHSVENGSEVHPASYSVDNEIFFPKGKEAGY
jgi:hypothetical protein